jgi:hypothetical protein
MWRHRKSTEEQKPGERPLREAIREARIEAAERTGVVVDLRDAEIARLELVNDELDQVFSEIPSGVDLFDRGISRGDRPRLWIDAVARVEMGRDKRTYRFVQDSRHGRRVLTESSASRDIVAAVTRYIAHRLIEHERALVGDETPSGPSRTSGHAVRAFILGMLAGAAALFAVAWLMVLWAPGP